MSKKSRILASLAVVTVCGLLVAHSAVNQAHWTIVGWNDLGMHCMDADYSVFSILPPFNNVHAQRHRPERATWSPIAGGITVTYEAVADPDGSINTTSVGKTNFWEHVRISSAPRRAPTRGWPASTCRARPTRRSR